VSSGTISRASLLYDNNKRTGGLITQFDYVAFDEIQSLKFKQPQQIQAALKSYMEFGEVKGFDTQIIILGNIDAKKFNSEINMVDEINPIFREAAILDRFYGFIPGWKIPRFHTGIIADGWALNTEYFAEVLHDLRDELKFSALVDSCLDVPPKFDKRDLTAITRLCTGFVKLLFPHVETKSDIEPDEFIKYCLEPAKAMRMIIKKQLCIIAPHEFDLPGKRDVPNIEYKY
jgi:Predicted ATP-dependent Lon-type protease